MVSLIFYNAQSMPILQIQGAGASPAGPVLAPIKALPIVHFFREGTGVSGSPEVRLSPGEDICPREGLIDRWWDAP